MWSAKLAPRYCGPFEVEARIGKPVYCLKLSGSSWNHPVFHVSLLTPAVSHVDAPPFLPKWIVMGSRWSSFWYISRAWVVMTIRGWTLLIFEASLLSSTLRTRLLRRGRQLIVVMYRGRFRSIDEGRKSNRRDVFAFIFTAFEICWLFPYSLSLFSKLILYLFLHGFSKALFMGLGLGDYLNFESNLIMFMHYWIHLAVVDLW